MKKYAPFAGWSALFFAFASLALYVILPVQKIGIYTCILIAVFNGLFFLIADWKEIRRSLKSRAALHGVNAAVLAIIFLGILVFVNLLVFRHSQRFDFTETGYYTLAPQTKKVVSALPREVRMTAFLGTAETSRTEFEDLVAGYLELSDKIKVKYIDPYKNPAITKRYGVATEGTVVIESGKNETKVNNPTEENLTNGIIKVIKDEEKLIYFVEGHGERGIDDTEKEGYSQVKSSLERDGFNVKKLLLLGTDQVPDDADLIIINGPVKPILSDELDMLRKYLERGGSVFILLDPPAQTKGETGLETLLSEWGIEVQNDIILDPMARLSGGDFAAPILRHYGAHGITNDFTLPTIFLLLRSVTGKPSENIEMTELLFSGPESWAEKDLVTDKVRFDEGVDSKGPVPVAVIATRKFPGGGSAENDPEQKGDSSEVKANLVVVGDSDFASNSYVNLYGNGDFFLNTASWLLKEETLISIRPRQRKSSPVQLTSVQGSAMFIFGTIVFPLAVVITGSIIWWKRRAL